MNSSPMPSTDGVSQIPSAAMMSQYAMMQNPAGFPGFPYGSQMMYPVMMPSQWFMQAPRPAQSSVECKPDNNPPASSRRVSKREAPPTRPASRGNPPSTMHAQRGIKVPPVPRFTPQQRPVLRGSTSLLCSSFMKYGRPTDPSHGWRSVVHLEDSATTLSSRSCHSPSDRMQGYAASTGSQSSIHGDGGAMVPIVAGFLTPANTIPFSSATIAYAQARKLAEVAAASLGMPSPIDQPSPSSVTCQWEPIEPVAPESHKSSPRHAPSVSFTSYQAPVLATTPPPAQPESYGSNGRAMSQRESASLTDIRKKIFGWSTSDECDSEESGSSDVVNPTAQKRARTLPEVVVSHLPSSTAV